MASQAQIDESMNRCEQAGQPQIHRTKNSEQYEQSVACGALPDRGPQSETGQRTNEPDFAENVAVAQGQQYVGVAAKVGVESGLDKRESGPWSVVRC